MDADSDGDHRDDQPVFSNNLKRKMRVCSME
jgi:hypothetical protein